MCNRYTFKNIKRLPCLLLLLSAVMLAVASLAGWEDTVSAPSVRLYMEVDREGGTYLCADPPLGEIFRGSAVALRVTLTLSCEGDGAWGEVIPAEGAGGLTLTVGAREADGRSARILLDGYPTGESHRLVGLEVSAQRGIRGVQIEAEGIYYVDLSYKDLSYEDPSYKDPSESVQKAPVSVEEFSNEAGDDITDKETLPPTPPVFREETTSPDGEAETNPTVEPIPPDLLVCTADFAGCQETAAVHGAYAVRFLFWDTGRGGGGGETPVICLRGGGVLRAEAESVSLEEGRFSACTFLGLREEGDYTFLIYTREGVVKARYAGGRFLGYDTDSLIETGK